MIAPRLIDQIAEVLAREIAPQANLIDRDPVAMREALAVLCREGWMALRRPAEYGGPALPESDFRDFQENLARTSGALAFLQTQHQSAVSMIAKSATPEFKAQTLPHMANGDRLIGIGFSQLRREGPPLMTATPTCDGIVLAGHVPWVTGWSFYPEFLVGAQLPDGRALFTLLPLTDATQPGRPTAQVKVSPPMELAAMQGAQTVTLDVTDWLIPDEAVAFVKPEGWIKENDMINITLQGVFALGCARAGLDILQRLAVKKGYAFLTESWQQLNEELLECRAVVMDQTLDAPTRLQARATSIDLAVRCAHAGITASSGAANSLHHDAQRVYREALVFTVSAQTAPIMEATLRLLARRRVT